MGTTIIKFIKKLLRKSRAHHLPLDASYVIPRTKHHLSKTDISTNALKVLNRLNSSGFQAYLVGGSVRDLLLRKAPKDFDIATNATPNQIRALFRNARIIGRRFKLVHIIFHRDIIEVATFRKGSDMETLETNQLTNERGMLIRDNVYGNLEEDAWRRDFTVNSLYYNLDDASIVDMTGGFDDVMNRTLRMIGDPVTRYQEDPVRMLRAIRFSAKLHFSLAPETAAPIDKLNHLITHVSGSRLFEEITKLYQCGEAKIAHHLLVEHGLFALLFEAVYPFTQPENSPFNHFLNAALENTDARIQQNKPVTPAFLLAVLLWFPLKERMRYLQEQEKLAPLLALEQAMNAVIVEQNKTIVIPRRFSQVMREIWLLQFRFSKRLGTRAFQLLQHPRFRAAYDFLALRALSGDESMELADWWTTFQDCDENTQLAMIDEVKAKETSSKSRRRKPNPPKNEPMLP